MFVYVFVFEKITLERQVRAAVVRLIKEGIDGDVLVFLPGAREIRGCLEACDDVGKSFDTELMALHGSNEIPYVW